MNNHFLVLRYESGLVRCVNVEQILKVDFSADGNAELWFANGDYLDFRLCGIDVENLKRQLGAK